MTIKDIVKRFSYLAGAATCILMARAFVFIILGYEYTWIEPNLFIAYSELIIFGGSAMVLLYQGLKYE